MSSAVEQAIAEFADEAPAGPRATRQGLLEAARRTLTPIRHTFVQQPKGSKTRASTLAWLVETRNHRALDALLLLYGLEPILPDTPLASQVWARLLSSETGPPVSPAAISKTWRILEDAQLITRGSRIKRYATVQPLREDRSGVPYTRPGTDARGSTGYFLLPHDYWLDEWDQKLSLAGKAMLLVYLSATSTEPAFAMSYEKAEPWYGISERTAERGVRQLDKLGLLAVRTQKVAEPRAPQGWTVRYHRYLLGPFSTQRRRAAQQAMRAKTGARRASKLGGNIT